jgi:hypothetical protein
MAAEKRKFVGKCPDHGITQVSGPVHAKCLTCGKDAKGKKDLSAAEAKAAAALQATLKEGSPVTLNHGKPMAEKINHGDAMILHREPPSVSYGRLVGSLEELVKAYGPEKVKAAVDNIAEFEK